VILTAWPGDGAPALGPVLRPEPKRIPFVSRTEPESADPQPTAAPTDPPIRRLQAIHRRAARAGWPPAAYLEVARWMHQHRPTQTALWMRLALGDLSLNLPAERLGVGR